MSSRNVIIWKLPRSKWNADPFTIRTAALVFSYSAVEYTCPVWELSKHARKLDSTFNECCWIITDCLKPTRTDNLHILTGIDSPGISRAVSSQSEQVRQLNNSHHPIFQHAPEMSCLHSEKHHTRHENHHSGETSRWRSPRVDHLEKS